MGKYVRDLYGDFFVESNVAGVKSEPQTLELCVFPKFNKIQAKMEMGREEITLALQKHTGWFNTFSFRQKNW